MRILAKSSNLIYVRLTEEELNFLSQGQPTPDGSNISLGPLQKALAAITFDEKIFLELKRKAEDVSSSIDSMINLKPAAMDTQRL